MEEDEQRRGEEMGLTVKQRQAVMEELRKQYRHASKKEKSKILDGFVDLTHLNRSYARSTLRAKVAQGRGPVHRPRASVYKGGSSLRSRSSGICRTDSVASVSSRSCSASSPSSRPGDSLTLLLLSVTSFSA